jgi:hypothetical protein
MTRQDDDQMQADPPAVGCWLLTAGSLVLFLVAVAAALWYGESR